MVTKRQLGIGYLLGTGLGLLISLAGYFFLSASPAITNLVGTIIAAMLAGSLLYAGIWLHRSELPDTLIWNIAVWSAAGLSIPTFIGVLLTVVQVQAQLLYLFPTLFINTIAAGGVIGVLLGTVKELRREHEKALELNRKNLVMNRVLRHNIRNDMNVILGYVDSLSPVDASQEVLVEQLKRKVEDVVNLSDSARKIESINSPSDARPIDVVALVEDRVEVLASTDPQADVSVDLPPEAWARGDSLFSFVLDNLFDNAVTHIEASPEIRVTVRRTAENVIVRVADNGPGIPERERQVLQGDGETDLLHSDGLGLWLVKWVIESYGGMVEFQTNRPRGSVVVLRLPAADPPNGRRAIPKADAAS